MGSKGIKLTSLCIDDTISMKKFVSSYCGGYEGQEVDLTHKQLKGFDLPYVKAIPLNKVHIDQIKRGEVVLVRDAIGNIAPYLNPYDVRRKIK